MKKYIELLIICLIAPISSYAQCNCETINRDDGTTITTCKPAPIGGDQTLEFAISMITNGNDYFISLNILFDIPPQKATGNLMIRFTDNNMLTFTAVNSQMAFIGGRELAQSIYLVDDFVLENLKQQDLYTVSFRLEDQILRTYEAQDNKDIIKRHLRCL
jgi:hypothetical protein